MTKKTQIKLSEQINGPLLKSTIQKYKNSSNEFELSVVKELKKLNQNVKKDAMALTFDYLNIIGDKVYGRLYPKKKKNSETPLCYCSVNSSIRSFFASEYYKYIDLSCCHTNIIRDLTVHFNIPNKELIEYCDSRESILKKYNITKKTINEQCNNQKFYVEEPFFKNIYNMIYADGGIFDKISTHQHFYPLWQSYNLPDVKNPKGKFIAMVCQTFEASIMRHTIKFFEERGQHVNSYIYDGILYKKEFNIDLDALNEHINSTYLNDFKLKPVFKNEEFEISDQYKDFFNKVDYVSATDNTDDDDDDEGAGPMTDKEVAITIFGLHTGRVIKNNGILYAYHEHCWREDIAAIFRLWMSTSKIDISSPKSKKRCLVEDQTKKWTHWITQLECLCYVELESVNILDQETDILPFNNGYFSFKDNKFYKYGHDDICHLTFKVQRKFPEFNEKLYNEVYNIMLGNFNGDTNLMNEYFSFIARGLSSHTTDKLSVDLIGERNSGKGFITQMISSAFRGVCSTIDSSELLDSKSFESVERRNGFLKHFCENLLVFSEEISSEKKIQSKMWKSIVSGGDMVTYRTAFGVTAIKPIKALYTFSTNTTPLFSSPDNKETLLICPMPCKFVDAIPDIDYYPGFTYKIIDYRIKDKFKKDEYLDAFTHFILSFYKSEMPSYPLMKEATLIDSETNDEEVIAIDIGTIFDRFYVLTDSNKDRVPRALVNKTISTNSNSANLNSVSSIKINAFTKTLKDVTTVVSRGAFFLTNIKIKPEEVDDLFE